MKSILIAGGTGMIGRELVKLFQEKGFRVKILSRNPEKYPGDNCFKWDISNGYIDRRAFPADAIINLSGEGIANRRWTAQRKMKIIQSRTLSSKILLEGVKKWQDNTVHYIGASAIGFYGNRDNDILREEDKVGNGFLADVTKKWEDASNLWANNKSIVSILRIGIVLSNSGGALLQFKKPLKFGMANYFGSGHQYYSWIHIEDLVKMFLYCIENQLNGIFNAVSPNPVTGKSFAKTLSAVYRPKAIVLPVPSILLKLSLGEMSSVVLESNRVSAQKIMDAGFEFEHKDLELALRSLKG